VVCVAPRADDAPFLSDVIRTVRHMDVVLGLLVLGVLVWAGVRAFRDPATPRAATPPPVSPARRLAPPPTPRQREIDAEDDGFVTGMVFSHYYFDRDHDDACAERDDVDLSDDDDDCFDDDGW
jgi:hypothetical protein